MPSEERCADCGAEVERFVNMSDAPLGALFIDKCRVCGKEQLIYEDTTVTWEGDKDA